MDEQEVRLLKSHLTAMELAIYALARTLFQAGLTTPDAFAGLLEELRQQAQRGELQLVTRPDAGPAQPDPASERPEDWLKRKLEQLKTPPEDPSGSDEQR